MSAAVTLERFDKVTATPADAMAPEVVAPLSTIDLATASGHEIPIEHRNARELTHFAERAVAAPGVTVLNPVFDVTPASMIDVLVTERGLAEPPAKATIEALFAA